ncbi:MAG: virulence RhuM family protein, partial [Candidatus Riflebacteria bacterium]|nr:virulence RhuM family protein [Candidatus Riflebacteria bacterium]
MDKYEIVKFVDNEFELDVKADKGNDTVWLNTDEIALLFDRDYTTIRKHISNSLKEELDEKVVVAKFANTTKHGAMKGSVQTHDVNYYNLDVIISVGYRVKSQRGIIFRKWA